MKVKLLADMINRENYLPQTCGGGGSPDGGGTGFGGAGTCQNNVGLLTLCGR